MTQPVSIDLVQTMLQATTNNPNVKGKFLVVSADTLNELYQLGLKFIILDIQLGFTQHSGYSGGSYGNSSAWFFIFCQVDERKEKPETD